MGDPELESAPSRPVTLSKGYWLGQHEITREENRKVMNTDALESRIKLKLERGGKPLNLSLEMESFRPVMERSGYKFAGNQGIEKRNNGDYGIGVAASCYPAEFRDNQASGNKNSPRINRNLKFEQE